VSAPLWTYEELASAVGGRLRGRAPETLSSVTFDSREVRGGEVFFAIRGVRMDGHAFAAEALRQGAALAVVSEPDEEMAAAGPLQVVEDTLTALRALARAARRRAAARVIGVTGSVGKTTTKDMLAHALAGAGQVHAARASFNNHWGVPLTLARLPRDADFAVVEMGMNAPGEIAQLTALARPHVAIVTHVAESHIGAFGSLAGIARAKAEIFSGLEAGGIAIINGDAPHADILQAAARRAGAARVITYGEAQERDIRLLEARSDDKGVSVCAVVEGEEAMWRVGAPGRHVALNSLAVIGAGCALGLDLPALMHRLADFAVPAGRGARHVLRLPRGGTVLLIDESYNANPASVRAALAALGDTEPGPGGRRVAVLGDMLELGELGPRLHEDLAGAVLAAGVDVVHACGPLMKHLWEALPADRRGAWRENSAALEPVVTADVRPGDVIMVKGSLGSRMGPLVQALRQRLAPVAEE
jgi:UDP-N-acetylmuramoyl-tripeptide--D-alanyl-D-alanine ligase